MWHDQSMSIAGKLLVATPSLSDPNFYRTVILLLQHDEEGALGVVLNRPSTEPLEAHLPDWAPKSDPPIVFVGGPVAPEVAIGILVGDEGSESTEVSGLMLVDLEQREPSMSYHRSGSTPVTPGGPPANWSWRSRREPGTWSTPTPGIHFSTRYRCGRRFWGDRRARCDWSPPTPKTPASTEPPPWAVRRLRWARCQWSPPS